MWVNDEARLKELGFTQICLGMWERGNVTVYQWGSRGLSVSIDGDHPPGPQGGYIATLDEALAAIAEFKLRSGQ